MLIPSSYPSHLINSIYCSSMNVCGLSNMSDSQTSVFFQHVINNLKVFATCCVFGASWTMLILDTVSPTFELSSQPFTTLYRPTGALSPNVVSISSWIALPDIPLRNRYFITARFLKFIHIGSRPSDHYFRSVCLFVCLFVQFFSAVFDPTSIKLGHTLYVWV